MKRLGAVLVIAMLVAACGASKSQTTTTASAGSGKLFSVSGITIHFRYPAEFGSGTLGSFNASSGPSSSTHAYVGLDGADLIGVLSFPNQPTAVTPQNISAVKPTVDRVLSQAAGTSISSTPMTVNGLAVLAFPRVATRTPKGAGTDKVYYVFDQRSAYEVLCQWTPGYQARILAACGEMLSTLSG